MNDAYVIGASMIPMGKHRESSYAGLAAPPVRQIIKDSEIRLSDIGAIFCGHSFGGMLTGQRVATHLGLGHLPITNVDNACSGGATALQQAVRTVRDGTAEAAIAIGVEKLTQFGGGTLPLVEEDPEVQIGMVMPALYAMRANRYIHERDVGIDVLGNVSVKARRHGARNPYAQFQSEVTLDEVLSSRPIADPLTLMQCCPTGDGAAAVLVVSENLRRKLGKPSMRVKASVLHSGQVTDGYRNMLYPEISFKSAQDAYEESGIAPTDLDVVELHDAFSIAELIYYEALGLTEEGKSAQFLLEGNSTYGGQVVVNPSGGLLSKGHPVGASGVAQVVELYWQLTGQAGTRQIQDAKTALAHVTGGGIAGVDHGACAIHVFERAH